MNILCITHADFETPGVIEVWAGQNNHNFTSCRPYRGENCLTAYTFDFLILMGGPQSPLAIEKAPYLNDEILLIQHAIKTNKLVLGFCLGAQLIGEALGGKTQRSPEKEVGVYPITLTREGLRDPLLQGFPQSFPVIHWHNDMPPETEKSVVLAYSEGCPKQIVRYDTKIYGFQCHMEITSEGIAEMVQACPGDLHPSKFTQTAEELLKQDYPSVNKAMVKILDRFASLLSEEKEFQPLSTSAI